MRIFVCVKQVPDTETRIKIKADKTGIDTNGVKWVINPYDEYAVEEAVKLKEGGMATKVTVVSVGPKARVVNSLRTAMAMGVDDGIMIDASEDVDALTTAKAMAAAIQAEGEYGLVFTGKLAIDDNLSAVGQMLAELLKIPHVLNVTKLESSDGSFRAEREMEGGARQIFSFKSPALIGANKGLNKPRFASLPGIMKAKAKPLKEVTLESLGLTTNQLVSFSEYELPAERSACKMISGDASQQAHELVRLLREEAKVL
jgi:electron transfer flavoprotein beta subunit